MKKSQRLKIVLELAVRREDECAKIMAQGRMQLENEQKKLADLQGYRLEYQANKSRYGSGQFEAGALENLIRFLQSLDMAVSQQELAVENYKKQLSAVKLEWSKRHAKRVNLADLIDKHRVREENELEKKIQKELDDRSVNSQW